jgi:hypothetical protein
MRLSFIPHRPPLPLQGRGDPGAVTDNRTILPPFYSAAFIQLTKLFDFAQNQRRDAARGTYRLQVSQLAFVG